MVFSKTKRGILGGKGWFLDPFLYLPPVGGAEGLKLVLICGGGGGCENVIFS